ncbi:hypothetical protein LTR56_011507 [Elasticomyces elasticus]|nr:hypothetical protein LTR22_020383 [Elasticomyces elasticus]KAK3641061.1 hypothetical protein LTR56_011507 [Elasticomyces elasticus]KAK4930227.1 hypothetical protein LTR49_003261 [Elasticomyces elasticus]KAK5761390.1 hypothetical protein LTS12_008494 [Elasticomyces elasticus]
MGGFDVISVDRLLWALFLLVLKDPWSDFRYVTKATTRTTSKTPESSEMPTGLPAVNTSGAINEQVALSQQSVYSRSSNPTRSSTIEQEYPATIWERLPWVGTLLISIRLNNWMINSPSHDRTQPPVPAFRSRKAFIAYTLLCFTRGYLILDLTRAYISYDPYFTNLALPINTPLPFDALHFVPPQLVRTMIVGAQAWALIGQMFYLPCLLPVGLHALGYLPDEWAPHLWPAYYGPPGVIFKHGIRGFWGQYWHQTMRWSVSAPGYAIADALRLPSRSMVRYAIITTVAFELSGITHTGLVPPEPLYATVSVNHIRLCIAGFFWVQAVGILLETFAAHCLVALGGLQFWQSGAGMRVRQAVNGVWVVAWFALTLPLLAEFARQLGYWRVWPVPISVWNGLTTGQWATWSVLQS